ncbi:DNA processing protein [Evansella caseinilytica]|uniref:DNA processing protein n=1 Tax=Evansella caseinilytica TaxID=1503961 RepID=A0A1H3M7S3_9BACI|nr:DNA-processing protein DprA [Evansella caseinilytica]SDY72616.1 DNA processing protein [Evansella caseinilytica]
MQDCRDRLLHLHYCCYGRYRTIRKLYETDPGLKNIYAMSGPEIAAKLRLAPKTAATIKQLLATVNIHALKAEYERKNINYVTIFDEGYPHYLKQIYDPPWILYYKGDSRLFIQTHYLSVVGTRHPSIYIGEELQKILPPLIKKNIVIVSGLALGIDRLAHEITIASGGKTIAVLGCGLDYIYPKANSGLFRQIAHDHLLVTEYPPYTAPQKWQFPERNRIISGLSQGTFVVEANEKSGSLITSDLALQQGRDVFALPGRISNPASGGTNRLIQEGAKLVLHANDILDEYYLS